MRAGHRNTSWRAIKRDRALVEQGGTCPYCLRPLSRTEATLEHIKPQCRGIDDSDENLLAVHEFCNRAKGSMSPKVFKKRINGDGFSGDFRIDVLRISRRLKRQTDKAVKRIQASMGVRA